jgi:hypothetical protein
LHPALQHLLLRLRPLNRALRAALDHKDGASKIVPDESPADPLAAAEELFGGAMTAVQPAMLTAEEMAEIQAIRDAHRDPLPLEQLVAALDLSPFEQDALLLCCAPELDRAYEHAFAQLLDATTPHLATVGLLSDLTAMTIEQRLARRPLLGRFGKLRRRGVLEARGDASTEIRQELAISPLAFAFLTGAAPRAIDAFHDPWQAALPEQILLPPGAPDPAPFAQAIRDGALRVLAVWGQANSGRDEFVYSLARELERPLLVLPWTDAAQARAVIVQAGATGALLWADLDAPVPATGPVEPNLERFLYSPAPLIITGSHPVRPTPLLESGAYQEIKLPPTTLADRKALWLRAAPQLAPDAAEDLASRFRLSGSEMRAAIAVSAQHDTLDAASSTVARKRSAQFAVFVEPKRGPGDLVLTPDLHRQVLEIASFYRVSAHVYENWGFGRIISGGGGIKALFAGDPGTGKTLAAEVIAGQLATPLLRVDLSRVVSKWVGETEKNLEAVFSEAEESQAVLLFDEAESLYGKRAEVRHGSDRYSNLEVGYLLQRLESFSGLVILASNLRDQIDPAFLRRFHVVLHFPAPGPDERLRIWRLAFPEAAPLADTVHLEDLTGLEMSGAAIVGAASTAALLAAEARSETIELPHVMEAIERQFRRDSKIINPSQLRGRR